MLTNKQRNFLRAFGNDLPPVLIIGKNGVTASVLTQLEEALTARELVKVRVLPHTELAVGEVADELAGRTGAAVVLTVGHNLLLYRPPAAGTVSKLPWPEEEE